MEKRKRNPDDPLHVAPPRAIRDFVLAEAFGWDEETIKRQRPQWLEDILLVRATRDDLAPKPDGMPEDVPADRRRAVAGEGERIVSLDEAFG